MRLLNGASAPEQGETEKPDLQEVLEHYGAHVYGDGKILCLVHDEDNPSMNVQLGKGLWFCHSCGQGGSSWDMIMKKEDLDFKSAVTFGATTGFASAASDGGGDDVPEVLGRRRPGVSGGSKSGGSGGRSRPWSRPW